MIDLKYVSGFYAPSLRDNPVHHKHIVKEYIQLMVLDYLSSTPYINKLAFIGGTNLRLVKGIDRWSESQQQREDTPIRRVHGFPVRI